MVKLFVNGWTCWADGRRGKMHFNTLILKKNQSSYAQRERGWTRPQNSTSAWESSSLTKVSSLVSSSFSIRKVLFSHEQPPPKTLKILTGLPLARNETGKKSYGLNRRKRWKPSLYWSAEQLSIWSCSFLGVMCVSQTFETLCIGATVFKQPSEVMQIGFHRCGRTNGRRPLSGLGRRKPDPGYISQVQRSLRSLQRRRFRPAHACRQWSRRFDDRSLHLWNVIWIGFALTKPAARTAKFAHKILEKDWKRRSWANSCSTCTRAAQ